MTSLPSVFISYSSKDVKIAEAIENNLLENGFKIWRDKSKIRSDWSREIANALSKSDIVLLIWSENSSKSDWVKNEWLTARALGKPIQLVIISALDKLPKPLSNLDAIVFEINENNNDNIIDSKDKQKIIDKLKETAESNLHQEYNYNILPNKRNIPFDPNPDFIGRDTDLVNLYLEIIGDLSKLNYNKVGITGIGGVGKTQLAIEFFYRYAFAFDKGIFWIDGTDPAKWLDQIVSIARDYLELEISKEESIITEGEKNKRYFIEFQKYCSENGSKMLLLVDNVVHPMNLYKDNILFSGDTTPKSTLLTLGCNLLFTTRMDLNNKLPSVIQHKLEMLLPESAYELLTKHNKPKSKEEKFAEKICNSVGYLPLAIVLIGGYLRMYTEISYKDYYEEHIKDKLGSIDLDEITKDELATRHDAAVRATFEPEWMLLKKDIGASNEDQRNQDAKKIISLLSLLPESAIIPKNRLVTYSGIEKSGKTKLQRPADKAFNFLNIVNLIELLKDGKSARIHPLLREFVLEKIQQENNVKNLILESIINLKKKYYDDFSYLVKEYVERDLDIDSILEDFKTIFELTRGLQNDISKKLQITSDLKLLAGIYKVIEQESYNLRATDKNSFISLPNNIDKSLLFAQQIYIRSTELSNPEITEKSRRYLETKKNYFVVKWAKVQDKSLLIRTLHGHNNSVKSVAITPDGTKVVSGSIDSTVRIWDINTGELLNIFEGHAGTVQSVAVTPEGTKVVSGSWDTTVKVWDLKTGKMLKTLKGHTDIVGSVAVTPDGTKVVSGSWSLDSTVRIWDINTGELLNILKDNAGSIRSLAVTPDGTKVVSGSDNTVRIWNINTGELLNILTGHSRTVESVIVTPDGTKVVSGSDDATINVWDLNNGKLIKSLVGHTDEITSLVITHDRTKLVSSSYDKTIKVWDLDNGNLIGTIGSHSSFIYAIAITPDNTKIVSANADYVIKIWEMDNDVRLYESDGHTDEITSLVITHDRTKLVSSSYDKTIKVWDLDNGKLVHNFKGHTDTVKVVAVTPDGKKVVSGSYDATVRVWDLNTGELAHILNGHTNSVTSIAITSDGTKVVSGSKNGIIRVWDLNTGELLYVLTSPEYDNATRDNVLTITPDNTKVLSIWESHYVEVWDLNSGKLLDRMAGQPKFSTRLLIPFDNSKVITLSSMANKIHLLDLDEYEPVYTFEGHTDVITSVTVTSDKSKVISGSLDKTIRVWDLKTGKLIDTYESYQSIASITRASNKSKIVYTTSFFNVNLFDMENRLNLTSCKFDSFYIINISNDYKIITIGSGNGDIYVLEINYSNY